MSTTATDIELADDWDPETLDELTPVIAAYHRQAQRHATKAVQYAIETGRLLRKAKDQVEYGEWGSWLDQNFPAARRTAQMYMRVSRELPKLEDPQHVADLSLRDLDKRLRSGTRARDEESVRDGRTDWPVEPGEGAIVRTPGLPAYMVGWIRPAKDVVLPIGSDAGPDEFYWVTRWTHGESVETDGLRQKTETPIETYGTIRPIHGSGIRYALRNVYNFPSEYMEIRRADWLEPMDYNHEMCPDRDEWPQVVKDHILSHDVTPEIREWLDER